MHKKILRSLAGLLLPFAAYGAQAGYGAYQRRSQSRTAGYTCFDPHLPASASVRRPVMVEADAMAATRGMVTRELIIIDANLRDRHVILKQARPGLDVVEIGAGDDGVAALVQALKGYSGLQAVHIVAHAEAGAMYLAGHRIDQQTLLDSVGAFAALNHAIREGGDLLLYGCDLAQGQAGDDFLEIVQQNTHVDIAASIDQTGHETLGGDWELEIQTGEIETPLLPDSIALKDFSTVLAASSGTYTFESDWNDAGDALTSTHFTVSARDTNTLDPANVSIYSASPFPAYIQNGIDSLNNYFYVSADGVDTGSFELTGLTSGEYADGQFTNVRIVGVLPDNSTITSSTINGTGTQGENFNFGASELAAFSGVKIKAFKLYFDTTSIPADTYVPFFEFRTFTIANAQNPADSDGNLTAAGVVTEPIGLGTTRDTVGEAIDVFDFTISDGGSGDGLAVLVSQIVVNLSGTSTDAERGQVTWRLNGPDVSNVTGTYNAGADTLTFSGLNISIADSGSETYAVNAYFNDSTSLTEDHTFILSIDGDTDLTVGESGTQMTSTSAVTNGTGSTIDVVATQLAFTTQPAGSVSGTALTTQPVVEARDAFGNTDVDFTETITLSENSAGALSNSTQPATNGVATFTNLIYTATADQQGVTLTANDQDGIGSDLSPVAANAMTSDVVATKLLFATQPAPTTLTSGGATSFTTVPVVSAVDANDLVDTGYGTGIVLAEINGAGSATITGTGDTDGDASTVTLTPSSGVATFTNLQLTYTNVGTGAETFNLRASSGGLTTADSSSLTSNTLPVVTDGNISISGASGTGGAYKIGDTVTATWNNTTGGDNNAGILSVTVDFSQFGGGAAVAASESSGTWTATYTIVSGAIDGANRNVSVSATDAVGTTTTADATNATVDNVAPTVTDASISISGASGTGGAFKIGDTVTATWNNTAGGDNNSDTISGVTVDFTQFGGGAAVAATNSSGTWTSTYTITAGAINATNRNVSLTATDNAGNATATADTTNATVDNGAPTTASIVVADTALAAGETSSVTITFNEAITDLTTGDFTVANGTLSDLSSADGGITWTATLTPTASVEDSSNVITLDNTGVTDAAGNAGTGTTDSNNYAIDTSRPTVTLVVADTAIAEGETSLVTITFSEAVTGLTTGDFTVASGALSALNSADGGITWTATLTPSSAIEDASNVITLADTGVTDAAGNAGSGTTDSNNYAVDTIAPVNAVPGAQTTTTIETIVFSSGNGNAISVTEGSDLTTVVSVGSGTLTATTGGGATITDNGTATVTLDGTAAEVNAALAGLTYTPNGAGAQIIAVQSSDIAGNTDDDTIAITVENGTLVVRTNLDTGDDATNAASFAADQADGSGLSIREALQWASGGDTITFDLDSGTAGSQGGTIVLGGTELVVARVITIDGDLDNDGIPDVTLSGNNASRVVSVNFNLSGIELTGLTLTQGAGVGGAGLSLGNNVTATVRDCDITNNTESGLGGGGIFGSSVTLTVINTTVSDNTSDSFGGGIRAVGASVLNVINSTVSGNTTTGAGAHGGGIQFAGPVLTIVNSTISGNAVLGANSEGGGIRITSGTSYVHNSTIVGNAASQNAGGVSANGTADNFVNTVVAGNTAGAGATAAVGGAPLATGGSANDVGGTIENATNAYFGTTATITTDSGSLNNQGTSNLQLSDLDLHDAGLHQTHQPATGSALIGAGSNAALAADTYDLDGDSDTGEPLPLDANGNSRIRGTSVDIGAVEAVSEPTVVSVSSTTADGAYSEGATIAVTIAFDLSVTVDTTGGTPTLTVETGATDRVASYVSGSGATTLVFNYTVQSGDTSTDLDYASTSALALNGATIRSALNIDALLTLPPVGGADSLGGQKEIVIDTSAPVITSGTTASATYRSAFSDYTITATGGAVSYDATGLPSGMSVNTDSGAITGVPTQVGNFTVAIGATDAAGNTGTATFELTVAPAALTVSGVTIAEKTYDGTTTATLVTSSATLVGVLGGDDVSLVSTNATATFDDPDAGADTLVTITGLTLGGVDAAGYTLTQPSATGTITRADQTIDFAPVGAATIGSPVTLSATASSGLPVTFFVFSGDATVSGTQLTVNSAASTVVVRATQSGSGNYNAATADQTIASTDITKLTQTITFAPPADRLTTDAPFALGATASSGLAVSYVVQSGPATVSGDTLTLTGAPGTITVIASQSGNGSYDAAASVTRNIAVVSPAPLTCFGDLSHEGQPQGRFAAWLASDGASGMLIGFIPGHGGFVVPFEPNTQGTFTATTQSLTSESPVAAGMAAAPVTWTFEGQIQGNVLSGTLVELGYGFAAMFDPTGGPTAALSGYFAAPSLDTTTGEIYAIVGTTGTVYVLAVLPDLVDGDRATINSTTGDFMIQTSSGVVIDGNVDVSTSSVDGAVIRTEDGAVTDFSGIRLGIARTDRLINLSSRARVGTGENVLIAGFVVSGTEPKPLLLRAIGPSLGRFDLSNTLADPRLTVRQGGAVIATNDDWGTASNAAAVATAMEQTGAFDLAADSKDAALLLALSPGIYTAIVEGAGGGIALAEIYDVSPNPADEYQRLLNISTRGYVGSGADTLIGGFIVTGNAPKRVLVRAVGASLARLGVAEVLQDPRLRIFDARGTEIAANDDWGTGSNTAAEIDAASVATGAFALDDGSTDAALLITLAPGSYTAHVNSAGEGSPGIALVEVYEVPTATTP